MQELIAQWQGNYGYRPTESELVNAWTSGQLIVTDQQANLLINLRG